MEITNVIKESYYDLYGIDTLKIIEEYNSAYRKLIHLKSKSVKTENIKSLEIRFIMLSSILNERGLLDINDKIKEFQKSIAWDDYDEYFGAVNF